MRSLSKSEFESLPLADTELISIEWLEAGRDLRMVFGEETQRRQSVLFRWMSDLRVELDQGSFGVSPPFTFQVTAEERSPSGFHIIFEFGGAANGQISFNCNQIFADGT
jgi:hypothetical protein